MLAACSSAREHSSQAFRACVTAPAPLPTRARPPPRAILSARPRALSTDGSAPCSSSSRSDWTWPPCAASVSGVRLEAVLMFACASDSRAATTLACTA